MRSEELRYEYEVHEISLLGAARLAEIIDEALDDLRRGIAKLSSSEVADKQALEEITSTLYTALRLVRRARAKLENYRRWITEKKPRTTKG